MDIPQKERAAALERAVINSPVEKLSEIFEGLGEVEMTAPALGLACRFRGLDAVRVLVEKGAVFDFPSTEEMEIRYHCHIGEKHAQYRENYRTNYSLYLLRSFRGGIKGARCLEGMKFAKNAKKEDGSMLPFLADQERIAVLAYLIERKDELSFVPEELLFYAIFAKDTVIYEELKKRGVSVSEKRIYALTEGNMADGYWFEFGSMTKGLADQDYIEVMQKLYMEMRGKQFRYTENMLGNTRKRFGDIGIFAFFLSHFNQKKMKKYQIIRELIDAGALDALAVTEREGWFNLPKKRDEMIAYAAQKEKTEVLAWLLEVKNRTADLAAEQEKAEKRVMRELSAAPDSVSALKKIWSYRKEDDGTLTITNYKGTALEVVVPEKIGKGIVTAIGKAAFTGREYMKAQERRRYQVQDRYNPKVTDGQISQHREITRIKLPETIQYIGAGAFDTMRSLKEINLPAGVKEIGFSAFVGCRSLKRIILPENLERIGDWAFVRTGLEEIAIPEKVREIGEMAFLQNSFLKKVTIPGNVRKIGKRAFEQCPLLEKLHIGEGVEEIDEGAFVGCILLKNLTIPSTVKVIRENLFALCEMLEHVQIYDGVEEIEEGAFDKCQNLTVVCPKGSRAEAYCRTNQIQFKNSDDNKQKTKNR